MFGLSKNKYFPQHSDINRFIAERNHFTTGAKYYLTTFIKIGYYLTITNIF